MKNSKANQIKKLLSINFSGFIFLSSFLGAQAQQIFEDRKIAFDSSYLQSKDELKDYILDTGDILNIEFINLPELSGLFSIDEQGEIYFERLKYTYVRGLTIKELTKFLEERYEEFLLNPEIYIRINTFKPIRISINGELRFPGKITFPAFTTDYLKIEEESLRETRLIDNQTSFDNLEAPVSSQNENTTISYLEGSTNFIKGPNTYVTTLSNAIQQAGGLTTYSDLSKIEIIRDVPIGKGGGKKRAIINFLPYINERDISTDIRLFDGDSIFIPTLQEKDKSILHKSILSGLSPKFIDVKVSGQIENPGIVSIPLEGALSDAMNLTGPKKPLSGKIFLIRYKKDGSLIRKSIKYSANASPGSEGNPYLISGDLITVKNSFYGRTSGVIKAVTDPFVGIYAATELYQNITDK